MVDNICASLPPHSGAFALTLTMNVLCSVSTSSLFANHFSSGAFTGGRSSVIFCTSSSGQFWECGKQGGLSTQPQGPSLCFLPWLEELRWTSLLAQTFPSKAAGGHCTSCPLMAIGFYVGYCTWGNGHAQIPGFRLNQCKILDWIAFICSVSPALPFEIFGKWF